jgi:DNA-binding MarR family transcriptional regulator
MPDMEAFEPLRRGPVSADGLVHLIVRIGLVSRRFWSAAAAAEGLAETDLLALVCLVGSGTMAGVQLRRHLGISSSSMSELADRLERRGVLARTRRGQDRREVGLRATPRGRRVVARSLAPVRRETERLLGEHSERRSQNAAAFLGDVARALASHERVVLERSKQRH